MEISNWINETERLYDAFTPRQRYVMEIVDENYDVKQDFADIRSTLHDIGVSDVEISWLERTGRLARYG